jgi:hypothetical protein
MVNNLVDYIDQLYQYEWILDEETYFYYSEKLNLLVEAIGGQNIEEACRLIDKDLLARIEEDIQEPNKITMEAYKFFFYHTQYIREELESQFGKCQ